MSIYLQSYELSLKNHILFPLCLFYVYHLHANSSYIAKIKFFWDEIVSGVQLTMTGF